MRSPKKTDHRFCEEKVIECCRFIESLCVTESVIKPNGFMLTGLAKEPLGRSYTRLGDISIVYPQIDPMMGSHH